MLRWFSLIETHVAGVPYHMNVLKLKHMELTAKVQLVREEQNQHDANAVRIDVEGEKLGYVPAGLARLIAPLIDNGYELRARLQSIVPREHNVEIEIFMKKNRSDR